MTFPTYHEIIEKKCLCKDFRRTAIRILQALYGRQETPVDLSYFGNTQVYWRAFAENAIRREASKQGENMDHLIQNAKIAGEMA